MEPAKDRRDDLDDVDFPLGDDTAAMEPAKDRRDDGYYRVYGDPRQYEPQWSPPRIGGTTNELAGSGNSDRCRN